MVRSSFSSAKDRKDQHEWGLMGEVSRDARGWRIPPALLQESGSWWKSRDHHVLCENSSHSFVSQTPRSEINHTGQQEAMKLDSSSLVLGSNCSNSKSKPQRQWIEKGHREAPTVISNKCPARTRGLKTAISLNISWVTVHWSTGGCVGPRNTQGNRWAGSVIYKTVSARKY